MYHELGEFQLNLTLNNLEGDENSPSKKMFIQTI